MIATPHLLTGAAIAKHVKPVWLALPLAAAGHMALDRVPHLDWNGMFTAPGTSPGAIVIIAAAIDAVIGLGLLVWISRRSKVRWLLFAGALAGIAFDIAFNSPYWSSRLIALPQLNWLAVLHNNCQNNLPPSMWLPGLATQAGVIAGGVWLLKR